MISVLTSSTSGNSSDRMPFFAAFMLAGSMARIVSAEPRNTVRTEASGRISRITTPSGFVGTVTVRSAWSVIVTVSAAPAGSASASSAASPSGSSAVSAAASSTASAAVSSAASSAAFSAGSAAASSTVSAAVPPPDAPQAARLRTIARQTISAASLLYMDTFI